MVTTDTGCCIVVVRVCMCTHFAYVDTVNYHVYAHLHLPTWPWGVLLLMIDTRHGLIYQNSQEYLQYILYGVVRNLDQTYSSNGLALELNK